MNLQGTTNHLNPNFADGHKDRISRFAATPKGDELKDAQLAAAEGDL